jgi:hypothetical protein
MNALHRQLGRFGISHVDKDGGRRVQRAGGPPAAPPGLPTALLGN